MELNNCEVCGQPINVGKKFMEVDARVYEVHDSDDVEVGTGMVGYLICEDHWQDDRYAHIYQAIQSVQS